MPRQPLVIAHHIMWTLYGWWLPNDPRGSTSRAIHSDILAELGQLHFGRKRVQPARRDVRAFHQQVADVLLHRLLSFEVSEFPTVAEALGQAIQECNYTCYGCAVMPDHVHLLIRKHRDQAEEMIEKLQTLTRARLIEARIRSVDHPVWTLGGWKVFLDHPEEVRRTIRYIEDNPIKWRLPRQRWPWVKVYDNWPLHEGH